MPITVELSAEGKLNTKERRANDSYRNIDAYPESYQTNTTKEELCQEYINSYLQQFTEFYPKRRLPFISVENEIGVKKLVCTTIRPTQLPFQELYDFYECASFLAGYITYEPLQPPTEYPLYLFSPSTTFQSCTGDSFDIATLMCSFLIGANYDAYVVSGYAPRHITLRDQSLSLCPLLGKQASKEDSGSSSSSNHTTISEEGSYTVPKDLILESSYLKSEDEKERLTKLDNFKIWVPDTIERYQAMQKESDEKEALNIHARRVHAWILIVAGKRDIKEHIFIEPSTGRVYTIQNSPYIAIESIWNHMNYFNNVHIDKKPSSIDYDFHDNRCWESLFMLKSTSNRHTAGDNDENDEKLSKLDDSSSSSGVGNSVVNESSTIFDNMKYFDVPPTWVEALRFDRKQYLLKYPPSGLRTINYFCSKVEFFTKGVHPQAMVMKITLYLDKECTKVNEIHEWYESRKDKLYKRIRYYLGDRHVIEYYHPGSIGEVKTWLQYPGKHTEIDFYVAGRLDRMYRRIEYLGKEIVEHFQDRTDNMVYRQTLLTADKASVGKRQFVLPASTLSKELYLLKLIVQYDRDSNAKMGSDVYLRTFFIREGKYVLQYHYRKDQISGQINTYMHTKGPNIPGVSDHATGQEIGVVDDNDSLLEAAGLEREFYTNVKSSMLSFQSIVDSRAAYEADVTLDRDLFEIALNLSHGITTSDSDAVVTKQKDSNSNTGKALSHDNASSSGVKESDGDVRDYLSPYLRNVKNIQLITKEEALEVRQTCLDAMKSRLIERANIIQARLNDENSKLGRKQEQFQRSQREGELSTEEYERYCTEAMFRIQILEQRLAAHEETALKKYADLDAKLSSDSRLKVLKN